MGTHTKAHRRTKGIKITYVRQSISFAIWRKGSCQATDFVLQNKDTKLLTCSGPYRQQPIVCGEDKSTIKNPLNWGEHKKWLKKPQQKNISKTETENQIPRKPLTVPSNYQKLKRAHCNYNIYERLNNLYKSSHYYTVFLILTSFSDTI